MWNISDASLGICVDCLNTLLKSHGMSEKTEEEYKKIFTFPIKEYYRRAGFDFDVTDYDTLAHEWTDYYRSRADLELFDGAEQTLKTLANRGLKQIIISASEKNTLFEQTKALGIDGYFSEMLGLDNIHARSKEATAKDWRKRHPKAKAIFIGDTTHDKDVADAIGADCLLIPNGHQAREILKKTGATVCEDIKDIPAFVLN